MGAEQGSVPKQAAEGLGGAKSQLCGLVGGGWGLQPPKDKMPLHKSYQSGGLFLTHTKALCWLRGSCISPPPHNDDLVAIVTEFAISSSLVMLSTRFLAY